MYPDKPYFYGFLSRYLGVVSFCLFPNSTASFTNFTNFTAFTKASYLTAGFTIDFTLVIHVQQSSP